MIERNERFSNKKDMDHCEIEIARRWMHPISNFLDLLWNEQLFAIFTTTKKLNQFKIHFLSSAKTFHNLIFIQ